MEETFLCHWTSDTSDKGLAQEPSPTQPRTTPAHRVSRPQSTVQVRSSLQQFRTWASINPTMATRPIRLLIPLLRLLLLMLSSASISTTIFTLIFTSQTQIKDTFDNTDNLNETELFLKMLNAPKTPPTTTIDPALSQIPSQHLQVTVILLFTAILANIVVIGMDMQRLFEDTGYSRGGDDHLEMRIPTPQSGLAQHLHEAEDAGRVLGGVEAERAALPVHQALRRSRTRSDLSAVDMSTGSPDTLNWRGLGLAEYSAEARSLRMRPQWISRRRGEQNYPGEP